MCGMPPGWTTRSSKGNDEVKRHDSSVHDHPILGKCCEAPDHIGPPISYMEERRAFKPAESINNPRGLCRFYHTSPRKANVLVGPKSAASAHRIHLLIEIVKGLGWQLTVVVFEGESVTPKCLLGELHSRMALSHGMCFIHLMKPKWGSETVYIAVLFARMS